MLKRILEIVKNVVEDVLFRDHLVEIKTATRRISELTEAVSIHKRLVKIARQQREDAHRRYDEAQDLVNHATALQFGKAVIWRDSCDDWDWNLYCMDDINRNQHGLGFTSAVAEAKKIAAEEKVLEQPPPIEGEISTNERVGIDGRPVPQGLVEEASG